MQIKELTKVQQHLRYHSNDDEEFILFITKSLYSLVVGASKHKGLEPMKKRQNKNKYNSHPTLPRAFVVNI